ncbi:alpha-L-fucosidase [Hypomontagnella monticulosa]|nr:alpha-L-fucosidase [Hypomontagnella monticulosa]
MTRPNPNMESETQHLSLHYTSPASTWSEALPVGNGHLGCMVYGRTSTELLQLNEDSVWYGGAQDRTPRNAAKHLPKLRGLIRSGQHKEAEQLVREEFFSSPSSMRHYEPLGPAFLEFGHDEIGISDYKRWLDIGRAISTVTYKVRGETQVRRDLIASYPDDVLALHITASKPIRFVLRLNRLGENEWDTNEFLDSVQSQDDGAGIGQITMHANPGGRNSNRLCCVLGVRCRPGHGSVETVGSGLVVTASQCLIVISAHTTYRHTEPQIAASVSVSKALQKSWEELLDCHMEDYCKLFNRTSLRLWPDASQTPTNNRLATGSKDDAGLIALYHNYGRYLLISSSRDDTKPIPANLQGIWNPSFSPAWGSKFTININLQMNYWPAAPSNLNECALPVVDLLERMAARGRNTARVMYGCSGWCAHHNTDIWADTDPQDTWMPATLWPLGGLWVCIDAVQMLRYHYDRKLHERLLPTLEGCMEFLRDFLIPSSDGKYLVTNPSLSPENTFISETGQSGILCEGSTIDMTIVRTAFELYLWSLEALGHKSPLKQNVEDMLALVPDLVINQDGLIQEWGLKDYKEHEPGHRHVSHLFGLYPGNSINPIDSPDLAQAARRVLDRRASHGGGHTGWSRAWLLNMHARLFDSEGCRNHMELLLKNSTLPNMLDNHPPFQIDGNFGGCAGILECLIQSTEVTKPPSRLPFKVIIRLLPACPTEWSKGRVTGVCVKGGFEVSFEWNGGLVSDPVVVRAKQQGITQAQLVYPDGKTVEVQGLGEHQIDHP